MKTRRTPLENSYLILTTVGAFAVISIFCSFLLNCSTVNAEVSSLAGKPAAEVVSADESIAVIKVYGQITDATPMALLRKLRWVRDDDTVKGVILRINSPGGGVHITEVAYDLLQQVRKKGKPVIAVLERGAFSGGYYLAAGCDRIVSNRSTLTGSIGVIWGSVNYSKFLNGLGIFDTSVTSGRNKQIGVSTKPMTPEQREIIQEIVMDAFHVFSGVVLTNRPQSREHTRIWSDGRIMTTTTALKLGLVDSIGYFEDVHRMVSDLLNSDKLLPLWSETKFLESKHAESGPGYSGSNIMLWYHL